MLIGHGRMGRFLEEMILAANDDEIAAIIASDNIRDLETAGQCDAVLDFSSPAALPFVCEYVRRTGTPLVTGTTGLADSDIALLEELSAWAPVLRSSNFSLGIAVMKRLAAEAAKVLTGFDMELVETHHNKKIDAPSGTAEAILEAVDPEGLREPVYGRVGNCGKRKPDEIGVHSLRGGSVAGTHTLYWFGEDESLEITHRAESRKIFAAGALKCASLLAGRPAGSYRVEDLIF